MRRGLEAKGEIESGAVPGFGVGPGAAAMAVNDAADVGEANAGAFELVFSMEALKDTEELVGISHVKSDSVVGDRKNEFGLGGLGSDFNNGGLPAGAVFDRVGDKIDPHEAKHGGIALDDGQRGDAPDDIAETFVSFKIADDRFNRFGEINFLPGQLGAAHAREGEEVIDQGAHAAGGAGDQAEIPLRFWERLKGLVRSEDVGEAADVAERRAEVMRDRIAEGFKFGVEGLEFGGALLDAVFEFFVDTGNFGVGVLELFLASGEGARHEVEAFGKGVEFAFSIEDPGAGSEFAVGEPVDGSEEGVDRAEEGAIRIPPGEG